MNAIAQLSERPKFFSPKKISNSPAGFATRFALVSTLSSFPEAAGKGPCSAEKIVYFIKQFRYSAV
jgi:hypothetical protein